MLTDFSFLQIIILLVGKSMSECDKTKTPLTVSGYIILNPTLVTKYFHHKHF